MDLEEFREYCLSKAGAIESIPFGPDVLVFKVGGKMFALASPERFPVTANLKCDPDLALEAPRPIRASPAWLSYEQETLEHGRNRQRTSERRTAQDDRPFVRSGREEVAEGQSSARRATSPRIAVT
jgi:hypothetical protein